MDQNHGLTPLEKCQVFHFLNFLFLLPRKAFFYTIKTRSLKSWKINIFLQGLTHGFVAKMAIYRTFFSKQYRPGKCFLCYSTSKKRLLSYKNKKFEKSKNWHFFKVVNPWFWSKNSHFSNFFFTRYSPEKCLSWYSRTKKSPSRQKKKQVQTVKTLTFFRRG